MFYRYEAKDKDGKWKGIFSFLNPSQRRYFNRFLKEPSWYAKHPNIDTKCWFTQEGYQKYHRVIDELLAECNGLEIRILQKNKLENIVCKGNIQCIQLA